MKVQMNTLTKKRLKTLPILLLAAAALAGCATTPVPADKLSRARASIRAAEEMNAEAEPNAALHLRLAREQLAQAKQILKDGDNGRARGILRRAEADADLAMNLARERSARVEAEQTILEVQRTKARMSQGGKS